MGNTKVQQNLNQLFNVDPIPDDQFDASFGDQKPNNAVPVVTEQYGELDDPNVQGQLVPVEQDQWKQEDEQIKNAISDEYSQVRSNLKTLLGNSEDMLQLAMQIAQGTENPKSIDSVTKLIGQIADINTKLIDLTAKKQDVFIKARPKVNTKFAEALNGDPAVVGNITNNTMFVGSITDLVKQLQQVQDDNQNVIDVKENE